MPIVQADVFDTGLKPLPHTSIDQSFEFLGYDPVQRWDDQPPPISRAFAGGFGCSPLSCNNRAPEHPVNTHCLLTKWPDAVAAARRFAKDQPEPGSYYIFGVWRSQPFTRSHS